MFGVITPVIITGKAEVAELVEAGVMVVMMVVVTLTLASYSYSNFSKIDT